MTGTNTIWKKIIENKIKVVLALILIVALILIFGKQDSVTPDVDEVLPAVTVTSAARLSGTQEVSVIGTVRAFSEASLTSESSGRVTSVNATLGQTVPAGFVLATLENASERASVLQAEGTHEAALAAARTSDVGLDEAKTGLVSAQNEAVSTFQASYNTVNGIIRNYVDAFFANPDSKVPGLKISGQGQTAFLNSERVAYQELLTTWQIESNSLNKNSDLISALNTALNRVDRTITIIDTFVLLFNAKDSDKSYTEAELVSFSTSFTNLRSTLQSTRSSLNSSITNLENAADTIRRAEIGASGTQSSAADAQVKQALGSLRAAQANLANTIIRTPISGTVNSLDVKIGDFVANQQVVAKVANNNALEIVAFVGDKEVNAFPVGSSVTVEELFDGTVTQVAPAVDPVTKKTEIRIAAETDRIKNGDTVSLTKSLTTDAPSDQTVVIPLSAVKFEINDGYIFTVEDGRLVSKLVELGIVRGNSVEVLSGLQVDEEFVLDARGLLENSKVETRTQ